MPGKREKDYFPLDLELAYADDALVERASSSHFVRELEPEEHRVLEAKQRKKTIIAWSIIGSIFAMLVVLTIVTSGPEHHYDQPSADAVHTPVGAVAGLHEEAPWVEGPHKGSSNDSLFKGTYTYQPPGPDFRPCNGSDLRCGCTNPEPQQEVDFRNKSRHAASSKGMVSADSSRCSEIGADVLAKGGNAVDAAVATALCQGVVNPVSSGIGGGAFIMIRWANGSSEFINAREPAPAAANATMFAGKDPLAAIDGGLSIGVPLELKGLHLAWQRWGSKPWSDLVKPAEQLAQEGFATHPYLVYAMGGPFTLKRLQANKLLREAFLIPNGTDSWRVPYVGELCCQRPVLADTLKRVAKEGPGWLYSGKSAEVLAKEVQAAGGIITKDDLSEAQPEVVAPLVVPIGPLDLVLPPPPSSAALVAFCLKFLAGYEGYDNSTLNRVGTTTVAMSSSSSGNSSSSSSTNSTNSSNNSTNSTAAAGFVSFGVDPSSRGGLGLHRLVECMKHGFAMRTALGDPGPAHSASEHAPSIKAVLSDLLNDTFIAELRANTRDDWVLEPEAYGGKWNPGLSFTPPEEHGTCHFNVVDQNLNAVSVTTTVNVPFGSAVVSPSTGILFNDEMDDFAQPNKSSTITPHPTEANFIAPGRRPLSAMSPSFVVERASGRLVAAAGASGGPLIVSATLQTLVRLLLEGVDVSKAITVPRVHDQLLPSNSSMYEDYVWGHTVHELPAVLVGDMEERGQDPVARPFALGIAQLIAVEYMSDPHEESAAAAMTEIVQEERAEVAAVEETLEKIVEEIVGEVFGGGSGEQSSEGGGRRLSGSSGSSSSASGSSSSSSKGRYIIHGMSDSRKDGAAVGV